MKTPDIKLHLLVKGRIEFCFGELDYFRGEPTWMSVEKAVKGETVKLYGAFPVAKAREWYASLLKSGYRKA